MPRLKQTPMSLLSDLLGEAVGLTAKTVRDERDINSLAELYESKLGVDRRQAKSLARDPRRAAMYGKIQSDQAKAQQEQQKAAAEEERVGRLSELYQQEYGYSPEQARAVAQSPQHAKLFAGRKKEQEEELSQEEEGERQRQQAIDIILNIKERNAHRKTQKGLGQSIKGFFSKKFTGKKGADEQAIESYAEALKKNPYTKDLNISVMNGDDDIDTIDALADEDLFKLGYYEKEDQQKSEAPMASPGERQRAEQELDVKDVVEQATPEMIDAPTDDPEQDEQMDPAALQMQQELGDQPPSPPQQMQPMQQQMQPMQQQMMPQQQMQQQQPQQPLQQMMPSPPEGIGGDILRAGVRNAPEVAAYLNPASRAYELSANVGNAVNALRKSMVPSEHEIDALNLDPRVANYYKDAQKEMTKGGKVLPTISDVKSIFLPDEWTQPQSSGEATFDEFVQDSALLYRPGSNAMKALMNAMGRGAAGVTGSEFAKMYDMGPLGQTAFKLLFGGLYDSVPKAAQAIRNKVSPVFDSFRQAAENKRVPMGPEQLGVGANLQASLQRTPSAKLPQPPIKDLPTSLFKKSEYLISNPNKYNNALADQIKPLYNKMASGSMDVNQLMDSISHLQTPATLFDMDKSGKKFVGDVIKSLKMKLSDAVKINNIPGYADYLGAKEVWAGSQWANFATGKLGDALNAIRFRSPIMPILRASVPAGISSLLTGLAGGPLVGAVSGLATIAAEDAFRFMAFLNSTPGAMTEWGKLMLASAADKGPLIAAAAKRLDQKAVEYEKVTSPRQRYQVAEKYRKRKK